MSILVCLLSIFCGITCSFGQTIDFEQFEKDGRYGLRDSAGVELVPPVYDALGWTNGAPLYADVLGYLEDHRWGLMTSRGKKVTDPIYYGVYPFAKEGLYKVGVTGKFTNDLRFGLVDEKGKLRLSCHYFSLKSSRNDIIASLYENHEVRYGVLTANFETKIPIEFREIKQLGSIFIARDKYQKWSFFDANGRSMIHGRFDSFKPWKDYLLVERKGAYGLIDWRNQQVVFHPKYKQISLVADSLVATEPTSWSVYDRELKLVMEVEADSVTQLGELLVVYLNGAQRLFADSTELLPKSDFEVMYSGKDKTIIKSMTDGRSMVVEGGEPKLAADSIFFDGSYFYARESDTWNVYNQFYRQVNRYPLEAVEQAVELYVPVKRAGQWGLLDYQGQEMIGFAYDSLSPGIEMTFPANYVGSWGVLDAFGEWVISPAYERLVEVAGLYLGTRRGATYVFSADGVRRYVSRDSLSLGNESVVINATDGRGLISDEGQVIFDPLYDQVGHMNDYYVGRREAGIVVKDGEGEFVLTIDQGIEEVFGESEGLIQIVKNRMHGFVDLEGRLRIANRYDSARNFSEGMAAIKLIGKWGFINRDERLVIQPYYEWVGDFSNGLAIVYNGMYGLVTIGGDLKFEMAYTHIERTSAGSYIITNRRGQQGLASPQGNLLLSPSYEYMADIGTGYIVAVRNGKKGIYNHDGGLLVSFVHDEIVSLPSYVLMR